MNNTGTRLSAALLGYYVLIVLLLTLNPFYLDIPESIDFAFRSSGKDLIQNLLLFIPLGFFYRLTTKQRGAFLLGAVISIGIESVQIFIPTRVPSMIDIMANTISAGLGAILHDFVSARIVITQWTVGRLRLETPLMGFMYLLTLLVFVNSITISYAPDRITLTFLLGLCGSIILSELFRHWGKSPDIRISGYSFFTAGIWFFIGTIPALSQPIPLLEIGLGIMVLTAILTSFPYSKKERRFEISALKKVLPVIILYIILLVIWEPFRPLTGWHWSLGLSNGIIERGMRILTPRVEYLAAFTIWGYFLAEWRGRSEIPLSQDLSRLFLTTAGIALFLEFFVGFQVGPGASLIRVAIAISSALFGGAIYHLLRAHIRYLLNR